MRFDSSSFVLGIAVSYMTVFLFYKAIHYVREQCHNAFSDVDPKAGQNQPIAYASQGQVRSAIPSILQKHSKLG